jgi:class 3 adenylate cyclase
VEQTVDACVDIIKRLEAANTMLPDELDMHGKFGIGYGEVLIVQDEDLYGAEVNLASKLGEDLASRNEVLLTESAFKRVDASKRQYEEIELSVSGLHLVVYRVKLT